MKKFKIPITISNIEKLKKQSKIFASLVRYKKKSKLEQYLKNCEVNVTREEYLSICIRSFIVSFIIIFFISTTVLFFLSVGNFFLLGIIFSLLFSSFVFFSQAIYPKIYVSRKQREIEKNLIPALEDMLVQLNSGIPLFNIMVNISGADFGVLSQEFKKAVKRINSGESELKVLNDLGKENPSVFFRRTLWQISNGMMAGSDVSIVIRDSIKTLNEEQIIQIQNYGSKLNPLIVMYMLFTVIIPTLSIAFLTIITSLLNLPKNMTILLFITLFVFDILFQVTFLGITKSERPSLL